MSYFNEGYDAKQNGVSIFRCPYRENTAARKYWLQGWNEAFQLMIEGL